MPKLAEKVTLDLARKKLFIDGEEFPYHITEDGPQISDLMNHSALRSVTLTFYVKDIEVLPATSLAIQEAQLRLEHAQRAMVDAKQQVRDAAARVERAQADLTAAEAERRGAIDEGASQIAGMDSELAKAAE